LLLAAFLFGAGLAGWHVAAGSSQHEVALVSDDAARAPSLNHDDQTCRVCGAAAGSLLSPSATVTPASDDPGPRLPAVADSRLPSQPQFAGPLGSRAPPRLHS
jgi:hypothetical protein